MLILKHHFFFWCYIFEIIIKHKAFKKIKLMNRNYYAKYSLMIYLKMNFISIFLFKFVFIYLREILNTAKGALIIIVLLNNISAISFIFKRFFFMFKDFYNARTKSIISCQIRCFFNIVCFKSFDVFIILIIQYCM